MATITKNKKVWNETYDWKNRGEEWSKAWGGSYMQWWFCIYPRIARFLNISTENVLEIACGFGRWTQYLKNCGIWYTGIDISEKCIEFCKEEYKENSFVQFELTDGKTIPNIMDNTIDFAFSFDSLVHADPETIESYVKELSRVLKDDGVAFIHHSNLNKMRWCYINEKFKDHFRDPDMCCNKMQQMCIEYKLTLLSQEIVSWGSDHNLLDCFSIFTKKKIDNHISKHLINEDFMKEAEHIKRLSIIYG